MHTLPILALSTTFVTLTLSSPLLPSRALDDFTCPEQDIIQTKCLGPKDCLYANPSNCASYIECEINAGEMTGTPSVKNCPIGLKWNDAKKECDFLV